MIELNIFYENQSIKKVELFLNSNQYILKLSFSYESNNLKNALRFDNLSYLFLSLISLN